MNIIINVPIILIITLYLFPKSNCQLIQFKMKLNKLDRYCLSEYFPDKTLVIYNITSTSKKTRIKLLYDEREKESKLTNDLLLPIITQEGGDYELCILNVDSGEMEVNFTLKYGVEAKDYSSVVRAKDLKPIDLALEKLSDRAKDVSRLISFSQSNEKNFEHILDNLSSKIMIFSLIVIFIMIFVGFLEFLYLKYFMKKRKII